MKNIRTITAMITITAAAFGLTACSGSDELTAANTKIDQLVQANANQAATNATLANNAKKVAADLAAEKAKNANLTQQLAVANDTIYKERVAKNHLVDQVKGAKAVAGTAVDRAHAKGVQDAKVAAAKHQKVPVKKS